MSLAFVPGQQEGFKERLDPVVAVVAANPGAVAKKQSAVAIAKAVYAVFGDLDDGDGLTRGVIEAACIRQLSPGISVEEVESRLGLLITMKALAPCGSPDRPHQVRYAFHPSGVAGLLVFERILAVGGIQEITLLLGRTVQDIENGVLSESEILERITHARHGLAISTSNLLRLVRNRTMEELLVERQSQRMADDLLAEARALVKVVAERFYLLMGHGQRLIRAAVNYCAAVGELWDRLLQFARSRRDFSMLSPEQYLTAALNSGPGDLAQVFSRTVFDPPSLAISADQVLQAVDDLRPRPVRNRPPRAAESRSASDPVADAKRRAARALERRLAAAELHLQGCPEADLTGMLRAAGWPVAARIVVDLLIAAAAPSVPFSVVLSTAVLVDSVAPVSYITPLSLVRIPTQPMTQGVDDRDDAGA